MERPVLTGNDRKSTTHSFGTFVMCSIYVYEPKMFYASLAYTRIPNICTGYIYM